MRGILGTFLVGLGLLPFFGTGLTTLTMTVIVGIGALCVCDFTNKRTAGLCAVGLLAALALPFDYYKQFNLGNYRVEQVYEGRSGVATYVPTSRFYHIIDMNRTASASALVRDPSPTDQYEAWRWNLTDLFAVDPTFRPRNVLIIGIGHAYLMDALLDLPFIERITVVDISEEVVQAVKDHTKSSTKRVFTDPRVKIVIADGRRYVQQALARGERFDLIQTKINEPWHAGSGNLFTVEFMKLQRQLLTNGGYLGVRPLVGHARDALQVFDQALYTGYYHVYFKNGTLPAITQATITPDIKRAWFSDLPGREPVAQRADTLNVLVLDNPQILSDVDANTDNNPTFEYYWLRKILGIWRSPRVELSNQQFAPLKKTVPVVVVN